MCCHVQLPAAPSILTLGFSASFRLRTRRAAAHFIFYANRPTNCYIVPGTVRFTLEKPLARDTPVGKSNVATMYVATPAG
jgi:hypothetical protein